MKTLKTIGRMALVAFGLVLASPAMAQDEDLEAKFANREAKDPAPSDDTAWQGVKNLMLGWGSTDVRYSRSAVPAEKLAATVRLHAWRGERVSAQAVIVTPENLTYSVQVSDLRKGSDVIPSSAVKTYEVGYVLGDCDMTHKDSMLVADPLHPMENKTSFAPAQTTRPLWIDVRVPQSAKAGKYKGTLTVKYKDGSKNLPFTVDVVNRVLPEPKDWAFHLDLWQNPYSVARYFNVPLWSKEHFDRMRPVMTRLTEAGQKVITCSVIQHPWNSQTYDPFESMIVKMKQLDGSWKYDYSVFDRWVEFMMSCGITEQIDCYSIVPWHYKFEYFDVASSTVKYVASKPGEKDYEAFLLPFLKDFAAHLKQKGWFDRTCIAMDERPMKQLQAAYDLVKKADPNYRVAGAFNYDPAVVSFVYDVSVGYRYKLFEGPSLQQRMDKGQRTTFYTCCSPDRPNTFTFSPPAESAYLGWHSYAVGYNGYLRWAYNSWVKNPYYDTRYPARDWASGDCFLVYPEGSSIRFERLVEGIQQYEKLRILEAGATPKLKQAIKQLLKPLSANKMPADVDINKMMNTAKAGLQKLE